MLFALPVLVHLKRRIIDLVRPGRLMQTLQALEAQMEAELAAARGASVGAVLSTATAGTAPETGKVQAMLVRLGDIRGAACGVLDRMQRGQLVAPH